MDREIDEKGELVRPFTAEATSELNAMLGDPARCFAFCKRHGIRIVECNGKGNEGLYDWISKDDASENPLASRESAAFNAWLCNFEKDSEPVKYDAERAYDCDPMHMPR